MTTPHVHAAELTTEELSDWGPLALPLAAPLGAPMATHGQALYATEGGAISTGIWQCGPGESRWDFTDNGEFIHVLAGSMTCREDDGTVTEISAGSTAVFPLGWAGTWTVHETLRKVYVIYR